MKIRMIKDEYGSHDGAHVQWYREGDEYTVGEGLMPFDLAESFLAMNVAVDVSKKMQVPSEVKEEATAAPSRKRTAEKEN